MENGGIFVAKARHLSLAGSTTNTAQNFIPMSPRVQQSPKHQSGAGASPWQVDENWQPPFLKLSKGGVQKSQRDTKILGKTVRIIKGPYKGHIGIVKDATPNDARVELHSNVFKIINFRVSIYYYRISWSSEEVTVIRVFFCGLISWSKEGATVAFFVVFCGMINWSSEGATFTVVRLFGFTTLVLVLCS